MIKITSKNHFLRLLYYCKNKLFIYLFYWKWNDMKIISIDSHYEGKFNSPSLWKYKKFA